MHSILDGRIRAVTSRAVPGRAVGPPWRFQQEVDRRVDGSIFEGGPALGYEGIVIFTASGYMSAILMPKGRTWKLDLWQPGAGYEMHRTPTLDFVIIVSGRLELLLDNGTVQLGPGDCLVRCGTLHGWRVIGSEPCTFAGVMVSAHQKANPALK